MEPTNKPEENEKMANVLTYGALLAKNVKLQKILGQEKVRNKFLTKETKIPRPTMATTVPTVTKMNGLYTWPYFTTNIWTSKQLNRVFL